MKWYEEDNLICNNRYFALGKSINEIIAFVLVLYGNYIIILIHHFISMFLFIINIVTQDSVATIADKLLVNFKIK